LILLATAFLLSSGCATVPRPARDTPSESVSDPDKMGRMGRSALGDFNFGRDNIPEVLLRAVDHTYSPLATRDCATLGTEILALDSILGPDIDLLKAADKKHEYVSNVVVGAIRGMVPFRGVLRVLTGADRRDRRIAEAIVAGITRRGYLKGLGEAKSCPVPAAPIRMIDPGHILEASVSLHD